MDMKFEIYAEYDFQDKRIGKRVMNILQDKLASPQSSIYSASKNAYQAKAAYRLLKNPKLDINNLMNALHEETVRCIKESTETTILVPQDSTSLNYSNLKQTEGLGFIGDSIDNKGIMLHSAMAVTPEGIPLGLLSCKLWEREAESIGSRKERQKKTTSEKESNKWIETERKASENIPENVKYIHICDREGDVYSFFSDAISNGQHFIVRSIRNRIIETRERERQPLLTYMRNKANRSSEELTIHIPRDSHSQRKARIATVHISYEQVRLFKSRGNKDTDIMESMQLYAISAIEADTTQKQAIEWHLLTTEPIENIGDAEQILQWYTQRWKIELFHRVLKEGCRVEELQESTVTKLEKAILLYSIVAVNLLRLTYIGRIAPNLPCTIVFSDFEWKVLYRFSHHTKILPKKIPTMNEALLMVAKLGGFGGRPSDGNPGIKSFWFGMTKFMNALEFAECLEH